MNNEMEEFDEKEKARRRNDQIEYRNKKRASNGFLFWFTIFEIIETFVIVIIFTILSLLITNYLPVADNVKSIVFQILTIASLVGGIVLGIYIYRIVGRWYIKKFNLKEKLSDDVYRQFKTKEEYTDEMKK